MLMALSRGAGGLRLRRQRALSAEVAVAGLAGWGLVGGPSCVCGRAKRPFSACYSDLAERTALPEQAKQEAARSCRTAFPCGPRSSVSQANRAGVRHGPPPHWQATGLAPALYLGCSSASTSRFSRKGSVSLGLCQADLVLRGSSRPQGSPTVDGGAHPETRPGGIKSSQGRRNQYPAGISGAPRLPCSRHARTLGLTVFYDAPLAMF